MAEGYTQQFELFGGGDESQHRFNYPFAILDFCQTYLQNKKQTFRKNKNYISFNKNEK